jgi:hypothetical protein
MKTAYAITAVIGLILAVGSTAITIGRSTPSFIAGLLLSNPSEWTIQFLHTPAVPEMINPEAAKTAILKGLRTPEQHGGNAREQMLTIGIMTFGFSLLGLMRERHHARRNDASNKGLVRTGAPGTDRQSAQP